MDFGDPTRKKKTFGERLGEDGQQAILPLMCKYHLIMERSGPGPPARLFVEGQFSDGQESYVEGITHLATAFCKIYIMSQCF